jgi:hypothetical protein
MTRGRTLARQHRRDSNAHGAFDLVMRIQHRAQSEKHRPIRAVTLVLNDERHRLWRNEARKSRFHDVFSQAQLWQVGDGLGMLRRPFPFLGARQKYRDLAVLFLLSTNPPGRRRLCKLSSTIRPGMVLFGKRRAYLLQRWLILISRAAQ